MSDSDFRALLDAFEKAMRSTRIPPAQRRRVWREVSFVFGLGERLEAPKAGQVSTN